MDHEEIFASYEDHAQLVRVVEGLEQDIADETFERVQDGEALQARIQDLEMMVENLSAQVYDLLHAEENNDDD